MWDCVYYLASISAIGSAGYGLLYYLDRQLAEELATQISWNSVKLYHKINLEVNNLKRWYSKDSKKKIASDDEGCDDIELNMYNDKGIIFIGYNIHDDTTYSSEKLDEEYIINNNFDLMMLKQLDNKELYKIISEHSEINTDAEFKQVNKYFIQIELCQDNYKLSIHKKLDNFYLKDNKILDKNFLSWYVRRY
tara:strand:- start:6 stop:584 length:579 start_codon:yes stop_codon:yes gene_type:complete